MTQHFYQQDAAPPVRRAYEVDDDLIEVLAADYVPPRLRGLARELGVGSALSSPPLLHRDLVNLHDDEAIRRNIAGPATAALLGGSVSSDGELDATGITFSVGGGVVGFVTFAIPAALLIPGGGFYVAYRLFRMLRDTASLRRYARVSQAAPHIAIAVAASDDEVTRDEARLLRDLLRGRVGSRAERYGLLALELDPGSKQEAAFDALRQMTLEPDDWPALLSIAVATAHADDDFSDVERQLIGRLRGLTDLGKAEFDQLAARAEAEYLLRCHLGEGMVRACYTIACGDDEQPPDDATALLDVVLRAAVPGDSARAELTSALMRGELGVISRESVTRGTSEEKPSLFQRVAGARSEREERLADFGRTMALFVATLEQWRGWVVRPCRERLLEIGSGYGLRQKQLMSWLREAHRNIEDMRNEWIEPRPWELPDEQDVEVAVRHRGLGPNEFGVTGLGGGRFVFHRDDTGWEWSSTETHFDEFARRTLAIDVEVISVHADHTTFELLQVTVEAHDAQIAVEREG